MRKLSLLLFAALCLAVSPALAAGGEAHDWEFGVFGGWGFLDHYETPVLGVNMEPNDDLLYGGRIGFFITPTYSLEASYQQLSTQTDFTGSSAPTNVDFDLTSIRLSLLVNFNEGERLRPFLAFGGGMETHELGNDGGKSDGTSGLIGAGLRYFFTDTFGLRWDVNWVIQNTETTFSSNANNLETNVGIAFAFGGAAPADTDGDGVIDRKDDCPDTPRGATVDAKGCPSDADGDGVYDGLDRCPDTAKGLRVDAAGCPIDSDGDGVYDGPDQCPNTPKGARVDSRGCPSDADGDGIYDGIDQCPDTPKGARVDSRGCPSDADGDGVYDGIDQCPNTPKGAKVDAKGCPMDTDGDGVYDGLDRCPNTDKGAKVGPDGCAMLFEPGKTTLVLQGVTFELNKATLTPESRSILDQVASALKEWSQIRVEVAGHTDSSGNDAHNDRLSQQRAETVRDYLVGRGVDAGRLTAKGYGEKQPVADNKTDAGRAQNRRVELKRIE